MTLALTGFEEGLAEWIATTFRFTNVLAGGQLVEGRNVFVNDLPHDDQILQTTPAYAPATEAAVGIYTEPGPGFLPSCGRGIKHEWALRLILRHGTAMEGAKQLLEDLVAHLVESGKGARLGDRFLVRIVTLLSRPVPFSRAGDGKVYATARVLCKAVTVR